MELRGADDVKPPQMSVADAATWYARTAHCAMCGDPGDYCTCRQPCPCADLHPWGSARTDGALDTYRTDTPAVSPDQDALFDTEPPC